ncbi:hypothetical protein [Calothrix sp. PCC 6303]|uniref:hypothetical protein n=1 Tax=Calothrix sp. PCC 6303 TaxID=1170562 RepID=UPI0002A0156C|nr:hypothetical protein [Calothrix sp. PCC 6303]AFZ03409.1 hypothetical protein Cal6303_4508 [Calothrix sp. PCC 6303]
MNSDLMPSPESSNSNPSKQAETRTEATANVPSPKMPIREKSPVIQSETPDDASLVNRQQPIPPPSEPMQYRAIGLVRGRYVASEEQFTQGALVTGDNVELNAVLLGRIMSLVKNHLDLEKEHLWVVYPRTRQENDKLHMQIVGVWEPENLAKNSTTDDEAADAESAQTELVPSSEVTDGVFSVRGEIVYQSLDTDSFVIKIKQAPRKTDDKPKYFKLKIKGKLESRAVGKFWDLQAKREGEDLVVERSEAIAELPKKRRPPFKGGGAGGRRPYNRASSSAGGPPRKPFRRPANGEIPLPVKRSSGDAPAPSRPAPTSPVPKPVIKPRPKTDE